MAEAGELEEILEGVVDRFGLSSSLEALSMVCAAKAEFLASNWQDEVSARVWARLERRLDTVAAAAKREGL
jgi:hypothetical protein